MYNRGLIRKDKKSRDVIRSLTDPWNYPQEGATHEVWSGERSRTTPGSPSKEDLHQED